MTSRLDAALAARGLARSRTHAATLIAEGLVSVDGRPVVKASTAVPEDAVIEVAGADHYVSRAAHKLIAGLDAFGVDVRGRLALDMGASTGGFTQVLRERVTSKGGTTYAALTAMEAAGMKEAFISALRAAQHRAAELGDEFGR